MAGQSDSLKLEQPDWSKVLKGMHKANDDLRKQFRSDLRTKYLTPLKKAQAARVAGQSDLPTKMRMVASKSLKVEVRETKTRSKTNGTTFASAVVRMSGKKFASSLPGDINSRSIKSARNMAKWFNRGHWRHPVYARPGMPRESWTWAEQTVEKGWFDEPFKEKQHEIQHFISQTFEAWRRKYSGKGFGF